jgi:hypothetical protein
MEWPDLLDLVARIGGARKIAAADICGLTRGAAALPAPAKVMSLDAMAEIYEAVRAAMA